MTGAALIVQGDALHLPLPDGSVDLCITSPPYWALRSYGAGPGEIGSEPTPQLFLEALWAATAEMMRVLKPSGSCFVDLGDKYSTGNSGESRIEQLGARYSGGGHTDGHAKQRSGRVQGMPPKSLLLLPERYRVGCVDRLGLIARAVIIWGKPNGLPESVTDRVRRSHEDWVHLVKQPRYYSATDEVREPHAPQSVARSGRNRFAIDHSQDGVGSPNTVDPAQACHPLGKLPGSVWSIPSEPLRLPEHLGVQHYACVDEQTEILTSRGWLGNQELEAGDWVAGYDLASGTSKWTVCEAVHRYQHDGPMVAVEKRDLSMRLTPNHRQVVIRQGQASVVQADALGPQHFIPRSTPWQDQLEGEVLGVPLAALLGWVAAEGWYTRTGQVRISQSRTANPAKVATLDKLLAAIDLPDPDRSERRKYRRVLDAIQRTERERIWRDARWVDVMWALPLGLSQQIRQLMPDKRLGITAINLPAAERVALLEAFIDGDGHRRGDRIAIFQKERHNLDVLQAIAVTLGYKTTLRFTSNRWVLYLTQGGRPITLRSTNGVNAPIPREHYKGIVWCPQTSTGTFIARRNGSVFITGNSFPSEWPRRLILGWSPPGICLECGAGRVPVVERERVDIRPGYSKTHNGQRDGIPQSGGTGWKTAGRTDATILGYACSCTPFTDHPGTGEPSGPDKRYGDHLANGGGYSNVGAGFGGKGGLGDRPKVGPWREHHLDGWKPPPTRPSVILDPFGGTGTVAMVARALDRIGISVDLSHAYSRAARWRVRHDAGKAISRTNLERQGSLL